MYANCADTQAVHCNMLRVPVVDIKLPGGPDEDNKT